MAGTRGSRRIGSRRSGAVLADRRRGMAIVSALAVRGWSPTVAVWLLVSATVVGGIFPLAPSARGAPHTNDRHQCPDGHRRDRGTGPARVARGRQRGLPVRFGAVARGAHTRARPPGDPRAGRALTSRRHRQAQRRRVPRTGRDHSGRRRNHRAVQATRFLSTAGSWPDTAMSTRHRSRESRSPSTKDPATRCMPARSTAVDRSISR